MLFFKTFPIELCPRVIPFDVDSAWSYGGGPHDSVKSWDHYYYEQKPATIAKWVREMECQGESSDYPTRMDGVEGWACKIWSHCLGGTEVVQCKGNFGHDYPFIGGPNAIEGTRIMWDFMRNHRKNKN